ncbi:MAG: 5'-3' exonuclease H3TH domain-containing protein, partial [Paracoccus sp. (in: a-proteobacteria)]|nr:5'-3' exonuclease H3TH domain-containing protein [Paracoccus sp. (in: a-proteobacteria)]
MTTGSFGKGHHLHLIDGSAFIFRAYHALPPLTRKSDGLPIGAVAGFSNMLWKYVQDARGADAPTHVAVIFDHSGRTFRNDIYPEYKANRPPLPEDLVPQFPLTREATQAFEIACIETEGYEADDIIATLSCRAREAGGRVTIISSDKDLMQLVGGGVVMLDPIKGREIGPDEVHEKFGVGPDRVVDIQALSGDSVDNVPGAPGIGIKTAALLINEFGDLDTLLESAAEIPQPKRRQTLIDYADQIRISRRLVQLDCDTPLDLSLDSLELRDPDPARLVDFLSRMEFRTLSARVAGKFGQEVPVIADRPAIRPGGDGAGASAGPARPDWPAIDLAAYPSVTSLGDLDQWIAAIADAGAVAIDTETTGLDEMTAGLVGISLCTAAGRACYIPLGHVTGGGDLFGAAARAPGQLDPDLVLSRLKPVLEDPAILKIGQNIKFDWKILARHGIRMTPLDDTMLMSYALSSDGFGHGMDALSERVLDHKPLPIRDLIGSGKAQITFDQVAIDRAAPYAAEDAEITWRLWQMLRPQLAPNAVTTAYETLERPMVPVLAEMEMAGIRLDKDHLSRMSNLFAQRMAALED